MHPLFALLSHGILLWILKLEYERLWAGKAEEFSPWCVASYRATVEARTIIVLARCGSKSGLPEVELAAHGLGADVHYADCNSSTNTVDARETGIILQWIIRNFDLLKSGQVDRVVFHHAHENSWHQQKLSEQLATLLRSKAYFKTRHYGEVYPHFICHRLHEGHVWYGAGDVLSVLERCVNGTSFGPLNRSSPRQAWVSGQSSAFFVSSELLTRRHSIGDYSLLLSNMRETIKAMSGQLDLRRANYYVGECFERGWSALFTNQTECNMDMPPHLGERKFYPFDDLACKHLSGV